VAFQGRNAEFDRYGAMVIGISPDPIESHRKFREKQGLTFPLLSDPDHKIAEAYGVYKEKTMYGKKGMGIERSTFVIDEQGVIRKIFRKVRVDGHDQAVLDSLQKMEP
jgi:peroxiredoxin Q/BCP